jgi:hypothetical protein
METIPSEAIAEYQTIRRRLLDLERDYPGIGRRSGFSEEVSEILVFAELLLRHEENSTTAEDGHKKGPLL